MDFKRYGLQIDWAVEHDDVIKRFNFVLNRSRILRLRHGVGTGNSIETQAAPIAHNILRRSIGGSREGIR